MARGADLVDIGRILCPIDFSEPSKYAVEHAVASARWYGAQITLVHVYSALVPWGPVPGIHGNVPTLPPVQPAHFNVPEYGAYLQQDAMSQLKAAIPDLR